MQGHLPGHRVEAQRAMFDQRMGAAGGAPQQRLQPRHQLVEVEGLDQVVVGTTLQPRHPVAHRIAGGEHQHRGGHAGVAPLLEQGEAIAVGEAAVEDHHVAGHTLQGSARLGDAGHVIDDVVVHRQPGANARGHQGVILDQQYVHGRVLSLCDILSPRH